MERLQHAQVGLIAIPTTDHHYRDSDQLGFSSCLQVASALSLWLCRSGQDGPIVGLLRRIVRLPLSVSCPSAVVWIKRLISLSSVSRTNTTNLCKFRAAVHDLLNVDFV